MDTGSSADTPLGFWGSESEEVIARQFPLHRACRDGDHVLLSRAVQVATPDQLIAEDQFYGWTPIHWASYFGKIDCLSRLLQSGVNVNLRTSKFQQTPVHVSAFGGHPSCLLELLKNGADFHARDYLGETPMHKAARVGNIECIQTLVRCGAWANVFNNNGHTASDLSRMQNFMECAHVLDAACAQLPHQLPTHAATMNGNGSLVNGSSGCHNIGTNGFSHHHNGVNGISRKRGFDDESIPAIKRAKTTSCPPPPASDGVAFGHNRDDDGEMECEGEGPCTRAPSPGMDMRLHRCHDEELQLWGHRHGYGDSAEALPDQLLTCKADCVPRLRGVALRGWK